MLSPMPLVSALCATKNRRRFLPEALRCFQRQDWPHRELVVLDDGDDPVADLIPDDPLIRYVRADRPLRMGEKFNELVRLARGDLLHFWDDDDWQAPRALRVLAEGHTRTGASIVGLCEMIVHEVGTADTWVWSYPLGPKYLLGGSCMWTRAAWVQRPFDDTLVRDADSKFLAHRRPEEFAFLEEDWQWYVATIHPGNTSPHLARDLNRTRHWRRLEGGIAAVLGGEPPPWWLAEAR
jgi:glycosyltransferase involved in cell wall biosynthesis